MRSILRRVQRERVTNYGDAQAVKGQGNLTLFTLHKNDGSPLLITVQCVDIQIPPANIGQADFRPMVHLEWGHGASSVGADFDCTYRQRIPIAASTAEVSAFIAAFPIPGGLAKPVVPDLATAKFRAFVSEGNDGSLFAPSRWTTQLNASTGVLATGQQRLLTLRAFAADSANPAKVPYFLLFDQVAAPIAGQIPVDAMPLTIAGPVGAALGVSGPGNGLLPQGNSRAYVHGIAWGISSTPYVFTADTDNLTAFVTAELLS